MAALGGIHRSMIFASTARRTGALNIFSRKKGRIKKMQLEIHATINPQCHKRLAEITTETKDGTIYLEPKPYTAVCLMIHTPLAVAMFAIGPDVDENSLSWRFVKNENHVRVIYGDKLYAEFLVFEGVRYTIYSRPLQ
jgi:hypothetical protein